MRLGAVCVVVPYNLIVPAVALRKKGEKRKTKLLELATLNLLLFVDNVYCSQHIYIHVYV